jgi:NADH-quinone oxidoreductase subunit D
VDFDLRRDMPYSSYEKFQFKVPISTDGDCWARYEVRLVEMRESVKIIQQALDGMPEGPVKADAPKIVLPDREKMKTQMEALIHHFKIVTEGFAVPAGEVYQGIECGTGRWATTWFPTAPPSPIACTCAIRRLPRCRRLKPCARAGCWPMWWR